MDNYMVRSRYTARHRAPYRRNVKIPQRRGLRRLLAFQSLVSIIMLFFIIIAKLINISAAQYITEQVKYVLKYNVEPKSILAFMQTAVTDIKMSILPDAEKNTGLELTASAEGPLIKEDSGQESADAPDDEPQPSLEPETSVLAASSGDIDFFASDLPGMYGMTSPIIGNISTPFGEITGPAQVVRMHKGIDISTAGRCDVRAALDGIVADLGSAPGYGNYIKLSHDAGLITVYANCSSINVKENDPIKKGDVIAGIGEDNMTSGSHLHFEVWLENVPVDPLEYIAVTAG